MICLFFSSNLAQGNTNTSGQTELHELAEMCFYGRPKCRIPHMLDSEGIDPFLKDNTNRTAREIAIQNIAKQRPGWDFCEYLAWELEQYEARFSEKLKPNAEEKKS